MARFVAYATAGCPPEEMGIGPVFAIPKALKLAGLTLNDIDVIELNEAFAAQSLAVIKTLGLDPDKVNVNGGAIALGHPLGCTGAKLTASILRELERRNGRYGMVNDVCRWWHGRRRNSRTTPRERDKQMSAVAEQKKIIKGGAFLIEERTRKRSSRRKTSPKSIA